MVLCVWCVAPPVTISLCTWRKYEDQNSGGSNDRRANTDRDECLNICRLLADCVGVDHVTSSNDCWVHTNAADLNNIGDRPGTDFYAVIRSTCDTCEWWWVGAGGGDWGGGGGDGFLRQIKITL